MKQTYNKLVRDKIPEIIRQQGGLPVVETLDGEDYFAALNAKLQEEVAEYLADYSVEELADIVEVIYALVRHRGLALQDFERVRLEKHGERGGFEDRVLLVDVERGQPE